MAKTYSFNPVENKFMPTEGDRYFYVNRNVRVASRIWGGSGADFGRLDHNNVFETFAKAHPVRKTFEKALKAAQAA